jgi:hypothetical protein
MQPELLTNFQLHGPSSTMNQCACGRVKLEIYANCAFCVVAEEESFMDNETLAKIRQLNTERLNCLRRISTIDAELRKLNGLVEFSKRRYWQCSCNKQFATEADFHHHIKTSDQSHRIDGIFTEKQEINFRKPGDVVIKYRCLCGQDFDSFIDRLIHCDERAPIGPQAASHGDGGELHNGKYVTRNTAIKGDPIVSKSKKTVNPLDDLSDLA